jgi:hypothetical protein
MLALGAANAVGVVLFGVLYAVAGAGFLSQRTFLLCLGALFLLVTVVWTQTERRHRRLDGLARIGRAAAGLLSVVLATPMLVLMPMFWLDTQLPEDAGLRRILAPTMAVVLVSVVLVVLTNIVGAIAATVLWFRQRRGVS